MTGRLALSAWPAERQAGVCLHITSLPGRFGIGEIGEEARRFVDAVVNMQLAVWQFLPTGPTAYADSPYQPLSTFAGNELLIDIGELAAMGLLDASETATLETLPTGYVDFGALIPAKQSLLQLAAARFERTAGHELRVARDAFVQRNDANWLHDYALFRLLKSHHGDRPWPEWSREYRQRDPAALRALEASAAAVIAGIKTLQFLFHYQWRQLRDYATARGVRLFGDLPIYIALDSADAWANPALLCMDADGRPDRVAGVPPDYFSEDGQLWGNPVYAWDWHAAQGFRWWADRLRAAGELADLVRIDHFRGFEAYWSVPAGAKTARHGAWAPGPGDAFFEAMQAAHGPLPIVAENLGVITPAVEGLRSRYRIPGMVVLQFDVANPHFDINAVDADCVCYTGTHDNDTTPGWFQGSPEDIRTDDEINRTREAALRLTGGSPGTIHHDLFRAALSTDARIAIAPLQDLLGLGSEARFNVPGTARDNWRWRVSPSQLGDELHGDVAALVRQSGRVPPR